MSTIFLNRYGITEKKKAELDALTNEVLDAQQEVDQFNAMVKSLTDKSAKFQQFLADADNNLVSTLNNRNLLDQLIQNVIDLQNDSHIALGEIAFADAKTSQLSKEIKEVIDMLIYSAEIINKLANMIVRKKAINPLISDDLVSMIGKAGNDANNAVALTLLALNSTFAAQATNIEAKATAGLGYDQALSLYQSLTGNLELMTNIKTDKPEKWHKTSIGKMIYQAYADAKLQHTKAQKALQITLKQLSDAESQLSTAQVKLKSLQMGLAAGNAVALAS